MAILLSRPLTTYYELVNGKDISECSEEKENVVRERIKFFADQFPYTSEVILRDLFNQY